MAQNIVHNGDWRRVKELPDNYFDLVIGDPPYYVGPNKRKHYGSGVDARGVKRPTYHCIPKWELPTAEYFDEMKRVCRHQIIWGVNHYPEYLGPGRIVWDKVNSDTSFSDCELAYCSRHSSTRLFRYMWNGMQQGKSIEEGHIAQGNKKLNEKRIHQNQKPVALYMWLLQKYAEPGFKIYDSHVGSGSIRIACDLLGLDLEGDELDATVWAKQERRYQHHTHNLFHPQNPPLQSWQTQQTF